MLTSQRRVPEQSGIRPTRGLTGPRTLCAVRSSTLLGVRIREKFMANQRTKEANPHMRCVRCRCEKSESEVHDLLAAVHGGQEERANDEGAD